MMKLYIWWKRLPKTRQEYDQVFAQILKNPTHTKWWFGQTYKYWADAFLHNIMDDFYALKIPLLIIMGTSDPGLKSCDELIDQASKHDMPITYWRIEGMNHTISKDRPDIFPKSIEWLHKILSKKT